MRLREHDAAALIDDGIVLTKSGGFLASWEYRGSDLDSATPEELLAMPARLNRPGSKSLSRQITK